MYYSTQQVLHLACIFYIRVNILLLMPGVPFEMKAIFDPHVKSLLKSVNSGPARFSHTFHTVGEGETFLEDLIKDITRQAQANIGFALPPGFV